MVVTTETLSLLDSVDRITVTGAWIAGAALAAAAALFSRSAAGVDSSAAARVSPIEGFYLLIVVAIAVLSAVLALVGAPTAGDAMSYHLPRVAQWIQNESVAFYPTHIERQLWMNPGAEYVILHLQLLHGSDRLANLVQWAASIGGAAIVFQLTGRLGATREWRAFSALLCLTLPMGVAQSTGAQTDLVAGFWLLAFVAATFIDTQPSRAGHSMIGAALVGASLGLAVLTKGTNYVFALPFLVWWLVRAIRIGDRTWAARSGTIALVALTLNAGIYHRNIALYGQPLGQGGLGSIVNGAFTPQAAASNLIRNAALHAGTPNDTRLKASMFVNDRLSRAVEVAHGWLGIGVNDPRTTYQGHQFRVPLATRDEIKSGNPVHALLLAITLLLLAVRPSMRSVGTGAYCACIVAGIVMFCVAFRWQPFGSRLQLPLFMAASPLIATIIPRQLPRAAMFIIAAFIGQRAIDALLNNPARPLMGKNSIVSATREERYFAEQPQAYGPYAGAANFLKATSCRHIGLQTGWSEWEYGFWVVARNRLGAVTINAIGVSNPSAKLGRLLANTEGTPCAVVSLHQDGGAARARVEPGFSVAWRQDSVTVQLPSAQLNSAAVPESSSTSSPASPLH